MVFLLLFCGLGFGASFSGTQIVVTYIHKILYVSQAMRRYLRRRRKLAHKPHKQSAKRNKNVTPLTLPARRNGCCPQKETQTENATVTQFNHDELTT